MKRLRFFLALCVLTVGISSAVADDAPRTIVVHFTPTGRAQIAVWIESSDGTFLRTLALTQAVATRGIGNRPGASQMNSGFRWPYGRREGVLPVWAHRRASAAGAQQFQRVIFQDRTSEGLASRTSSDFSRDDYYCLSFNQATTTREALDAMSCASVFNSDKGRYIAPADVAASYSEPFVDGTTHTHRTLSLDSLYPPRRDVNACVGVPGCFDHPDAAKYAADARRVMPEIDTISMATPPGDVEKVLYFDVPRDWPDGDYKLYVEVNVEGDYNDTFNPTTYPTPSNTAGSDDWDIWALTYGYPFRGQPSIVYAVNVTIGSTTSAEQPMPIGYGSLSGVGDSGGALHDMDGTMTNDPAAHPGSGADRIRAIGHDYRLRVEARTAAFCAMNTPPGTIAGLTATPSSDPKQSHHWGHLTFTVPSDDQSIAGYDVRVGTDPIVDNDSFMHALPANAATLDSLALVVPTDGAAGSTVDVDFGGMMPTTHYYIGVRAYDACNANSPIAVTEMTTTEIHFTVVSPCFVATAAYGTPMAREIGVLRRFRDRNLMTNAPGRALVHTYYSIGPVVADYIRQRDTLRAAVRLGLTPLVGLADAWDSATR